MPAATAWNSLSGNTSPTGACLEHQLHRSHQPRKAYIIHGHWGVSPLFCLVLETYKLDGVHTFTEDGVYFIPDKT